MGNWYESQSSTVYSKYYYHNGVRVAVRRTGYASNNGIFWLLTDHLGGTNVTLNSTGGYVTELRYYPFGDTRYNPSSQLTNYRFTGQWMDFGPNLYNYGSRWYDPVVGRFIQADTIVPNPGNPEAMNRYAYALNNPIKYRDPSGHVACSGIGYPGSVGGYGSFCMEQSWAPSVTSQQSTALVVSLAPWVGLLSANSQPIVATAGQVGENASGATQSASQSGEPANPPPPDPRQNPQELAVREMLTNQRYEQPYGTSDAAIRQNLGMKGPTADIVGFHSQQGRWLIAESKGGDILGAYHQLGNTMSGLLAKIPSAAGNIELRIYTNASQYARLIGKEGVGGYFVRNGHLMYKDEAEQWLYEMINGVRILVQQAAQ